MKEEIKKLQNEELENVTGGSCYSSETYQELWIEGDSDYGQRQDYHPLIVTIGNTCSLSSDTCLTCGGRRISKHTALTNYCKRRSEEVDNA